MDPDAAHLEAETLSFGISLKIISEMVADELVVSECI